jgi:hypothetical protein
MAKESERINRIQTPIDLAVRMFNAQQERLMTTIVGPERQTRREMVGGVPLEQILPNILADMEQP